MFGWPWFDRKDPANLTAILKARETQAYTVRDMRLDAIMDRLTVILGAKSITHIRSEINQLKADIGRMA